MSRGQRQRRRQGQAQKQKRPPRYAREKRGQPFIAQGHDGGRYEIKTGAGGIVLQPDRGQRCFEDMLTVLKGFIGSGET
jgi:hypothetical protein